MLVAEPIAKPRKKLMTIVTTPPWERLITELAVNSRQLSRSKIVRQAIIEKADRELPSNWRETVQFDDEGAAA